MPAGDTKSATVRAGGPPVGRRPLLAAHGKRFVADQGGVVAITVVLLIPVLLLFIGLGLEVGTWYTIERQLQSTADTAAVAAADELAAGNSFNTATTKAAWAASRDGFLGTPTVNVPPKMGAFAANSNAVEVIVQRSVLPLFANVWQSSVAVGARAVATWTTAYATCGLALSTSGTGVSIKGNVTLDLGSGCVLASNSTSAKSISASGAAASITAQTIISAGGINIKAGDLHLQSASILGAPASTDPYAGVAFTVPTWCELTEGAAVLSPGCYKSFDITDDTTLQPGTYYINHADFSVKKATLNGTGGVTIILGSNDGVSCEGNVSFEAKAVVNLTAPSDGWYAGMAIIQVGPSGSSCAASSSMTANATATLNGIVYSPDAAWDFKGGATTDNDCLMIVADTITYQGDVTLANSGCASPPGVDFYNVATISLAE